MHADLFLYRVQRQNPCVEPPKLPPLLILLSCRPTSIDSIVFLIDHLQGRNNRRSALPFCQSDSELGETIWCSIEYLTAHTDGSTVWKVVSQVEIRADVKTYRLIIGQNWQDVWQRRIILA